MTRELCAKTACSLVVGDYYIDLANPDIELVS